MGAFKSASQRVRICAIVALVSALTSLGFSLAALPGGGLYAMYASARSVPLAIVSAIFAARPSRGAAATLALLMGLVQGADALVGLLSHDVVKTVGPAFLTVVTLGSLVLLRIERASDRP